MDTEVRAAIHAALGDPLRLAIVDLLAHSDRSPSELAEGLGVASNLLAHHLEVLDRTGIIQRSPSHGDARRRYLRLLPDRLDSLLSVRPLRVSSVLFVCTHNSARSQFAEAIWKVRSSVPAQSAGTRPSRQVDPIALKVAKRHGLDLGGARPKGYVDVEGQPDLVVSVCDQAREGSWPFVGEHLHWSIPDPVGSKRVGAFEEAIRQVEERVARLAPHIERSTD